MKKIITTTFGILFVLYMLILVFYNNFNIGILIPMIFGVICLVQMLLNGLRDFLYYAQLYL